MRTFVWVMFIVNVFNCLLYLKEAATEMERVKRVRSAILFLFPLGLGIWTAILLWGNR